MRTAVRALLIVVAVGCGGTPKRVDPALRRQAAEPAVKALRDGDFVGAKAAAGEVLSADRGNAVAAGVRALARYQEAGARLRGDFEAALDTMGSRIDHARFRAIEQRFVDELEGVEADLAVAAADDGFALELCLACWRHDWNHSGEVDERDELLFQIEVDARGEELPEQDPRRKPTFRFDVGDVHWARAMVAFQRAAFELVLAYKWTELDKLIGALFSDHLPVITIHLDDAGRVRTARGLILDGLAHAERARAAYLAETDDDREWVPAPDQRDHAVPLAIDASVYDTWAGVVGDLRRLIAGEEGLAIGELAQLGDHRWARPPAGFIDVHGLLERPGDIVLDPDKLDRLDDAPVRDDPAAAEAVLRDVLGRALVPAMKPSPLVGRLLRMRDELDRDEDTFERKLRYLLWLN